jgi:hypothetical protein
VSIIISIHGLYLVCITAVILGVLLFLAFVVLFRGGF